MKYFGIIILLVSHLIQAHEGLIELGETQCEVFRERIEQIEDLGLRQSFSRHYQILCEASGRESFEEQTYLSDLIEEAERVLYVGSEKRAAKILGPFKSKHQACARGCGYVSWGIWGDSAHRRRRSCHNSGEAIDIHAIRCSGRTFGPGTSRFRQYVGCMRGRFRTIFGNAQHRNHAHFEFHGCRRITGK